MNSCATSCCTCSPKGFVRIRNIDLLASRRRATTLPLCFQLLGSGPQVEQEVSTARPSDTWLCPNRGGRWWSSRDHRRRDSTALSPQCSSLPHEATLSNGILRVFRRAPYRCALPPNTSLLPASSTTPFAILSRGGQLRGADSSTFHPVARLTLSLMCSTLSRPVSGFIDSYPTLVGGTGRSNSLLAC